MKSLRSVLAVSILLTALPIGAQQEESYDYWQPQRHMVRLGQQAIFMCNGLFTSNRTLEQVFAQELAYLPEPVGTAEGGDYEIDRERKAVTIGSGHGVPKMRAVFREGIGCVVLAPDQAFDDVDSLPAIEMPPPPGDAAKMPWPDGDKTGPIAPPADVDGATLQAASDWAFDRESPHQVTLSLLVVHRGRIVHERYAEGVDMTTRTRTWSTAKSIASTLIGMLVDDGRLALDEPLGFDFLPEEAAAAETDPRSAITLRHALHMSSGLQTVDNGGQEYAVGSGMSYWAGASSVEGARRRALIREPGANWGLRELRHPARRLRDEARPRQPDEVPRVPPQAPPRPHRHEEHPAEHRPLRRLHPQQSGLHERPRPRSLRPPLPPERPLERRAPPLRELDRLRPHTGPVNRRPRQLLRGPVLARPPTNARTSPETPTPPPATAASSSSSSPPTTWSSSAAASTGVVRASTAGT